MVIFSQDKNSLKEINQSQFKLEKDIQNITEKNLKDVFGLEFVKSEFQLNNLRIDTLAFDKLTNSFVIIEYKKDKNFSVIDQGYAYLALLLNNKADFILEYNENKNTRLSRNDIEWSQSRVIFISSQYTEYQKQAINFKDLPIEIWEIKKYENDIIVFNQIKPHKTSESITKIAKVDGAVQKVAQEIKTFTEDSHLEKASDEIKELYEKIKQEVLDIDSSFIFNPRKYYISIKRNKNLAFIEFRKKKINIIIPVSYERGRKLIKHHKIRKPAESVQKFWFSVPCFEVSLENDENLYEVINLIKEASKTI
ncbi:MAG: DUF5655 domain-containing protein [Candidatus Firestonebacteria bacterium]